MLPSARRSVAIVLGSYITGSGIGHDLVRHTALLSLRVAELVAVRALVVDAVDHATAGFYERAGFTPNEANPLRFEILVKDREVGREC